MPSKQKLKLHILGGGPAGLAAGYFAKKKNIDLEIFEASDMVGGNCKTIERGEYRFDTGAHRFHDKNNKVIEGNPDTIKTVNDVWSFSKNMWSQDPTWYLVDTSSK